MFAVNFKYKDVNDTLLVLPSFDYQLVDMHFIKLQNHNNLFLNVNSSIFDVEGNEYTKSGGFSRDKDGKVYLPLEHICNIIHRQSFGSSVPDSHAQLQALELIKEKFNCTFKGIVLDCTRSEGYKVLYI